MGELSAFAIGDAQLAFQLELFHGNGNQFASIADSLLHSVIHPLTEPYLLINLRLTVTL